MNRNGLVWLNGSFMSFEEAKVSIEDRGFQFADGVYEVVRVYDGKPFTFREHLKRLRQSATQIELDFKIKDDELEEIGQKLVSRSGLKDAELYIQITRGVAPRSHVFPKEISPTVLLSIRSVRPLPEGALENGLSAITLPDERWSRCHIKSISLLPNVLAKEKARRVGAYEAIFIRNGIVTEGASSNVFLLLEGVLRTPPADWRILRGITRDLVLKIAGSEGLPFKEEEFGLEKLYSAEEVFITSTAIEILPVVEIDKRKIGTGKPGAVQSLLYQKFKQLVKENPAPAL
ncbi:MAG: D-amino-acid transaminase [Coprothermobacterota bacterium]|nr:D-amino-acid transaminase [Coprothermobacterota bacterium]